MAIADDVIPVLDIAPLRAGVPGALEKLGAELRRAFTEVGFYFVRGHGVPDALVEEVFEATRRFHAQPMDTKMAMQFDSNNTGYLPMRGATTRMNALGTPQKPNFNEAVFFKRDLPPDHPDVLAGKRFRGINRWPAALPGFRETALAYMRRWRISVAPWCRSMPRPSPCRPNGSTTSSRTRCSPCG